MVDKLVVTNSLPLKHETESDKLYLTIGFG